MSATPHGPGFRWKYSVRPSRERLGASSMPAVLIASPRLTGVSHGLSIPARCETQRSMPPLAPGRSDRCELMYSVRPFFEMAGCESVSAEFTIAPRLIGGDHGDHFDSSSFPFASRRSAFGALALGPVNVPRDLSSEHA